MDVQDVIIIGQEVAESRDKRRNVAPAIRHDANDAFVDVGNFFKGGANFFFSRRVDDWNQRVEFVRNVRAMSRHFLKQVEIKNVRLNCNFARLILQLSVEKFFGNLYEVHLACGRHASQQARYLPIFVAASVLEQRRERLIKPVLERFFLFGVERQGAIKNVRDGQNFFLAAKFQPITERVALPRIQIPNRIIFFREPLIFREKFFILFGQFIQALREDDGIIRLRLPENFKRHAAGKIFDVKKNLRVARPKSSEAAEMFARVVAADRMFHAVNQHARHLDGNFVLAAVNQNVLDFDGNKIRVGVEAQNFRRAFQIEIDSPVKFSWRVDVDNFFCRVKVIVAVRKKNFRVEHCVFPREIEHVEGAAVPQKSFFVVAVKIFYLSGGGRVVQ